MKDKSSISYNMSERRGSNPRPLPWEGSILPLNYSRNNFNSTLFIAKIQYFCYINTVWRHRLMVRTPDFQSGNRGSIPRGATNLC